MANAEVRVAIVGDNSSLQQSLDQSQSKLSSFGRAVGKIAVAAGVAAAGGLALLGKASIEAASAAQQSLGGTQAVFGKFADQVIRDGRRAADAFGLSGNQYRESANIIGALLLNQGEQQDKLADSTRNLIGQAADLAATYGGTTKDAVDALASAFKGEFDPLQNFGITLLQSKVNLEAMRLAGVATTAEFNKLSSATQTAYKRQATMSLITQQSGIAQGQFQKQLGTVAEQTQVLGAQWDNLKTRIGKALLPVLSVLLTRLNNELMPALRQLAKTYLPAVQSALLDMVEGDPGATFDKLRDSVGSIDWQGMSQSAGDLAETLHELGPALAGISVETVNSSLRVFATLIGFAADHLDLLRKVLPALVIAYAALKAAQLANSIAGRDSIVGLIAQWAATRKLIATQRELVAITREVAVAQGVQVEAMAATTGATAAASANVSKLGGAARGAAGIAGLGLLTVGLTSTNDSLSTMSTVAGAAASGFAVGGPWGAAIGGAIGLVYELWHANDNLNASLANLDTAKASGDLDAYAQSIERAQAELDKMKLGAASADKSWLGPLQSLTELPAAWDLVTGKTGEASRAIDEATTELDGLRNGTLQLFNPVADLASGIGDVVQNALDEADALREATDAMRDKRREASQGLNAELDYQQAIDDAARSLKENGKTVNKSTEAGRANLRSLSDLADAWNRQSDATKNARGSLSAARKGFIDTAQSMGLSEQAAKRLADRLFEIPPKRKTVIQLDGVDGATQNARTLKDILDQLKSKDITIALHYQTIGNKPKAPIPGDGGAPRLASPAEQRRQTDKMSLYGERLGDAFGKGAAKGAGKHADELATSLFGPIGAGAQLTADEIRTALGKATDYVRKIVSARIKDDKQAAKRSKAILADLAQRYRLLRANAKAQEQNNTALANAVDVAAKFHAFADAIRDTFVSFGDITQLGRLDSGKVSLSKLLTELRKRAADAAEFQRLVAQLAAQGLSQTAIEQLTAQGPEQALATVRAIVSGGQAAVTEINALQSQIAASGGALGQTLADKFDVGGNQLGTVAADALVARLTAHQKELNKTAERMAAALAAALRAELAQIKPTKARGGAQQQQGGGGGAQQQQQRVTVQLTSQQVSSLERGRAIQLDLDTYRAAGGRARV